jgi:hypothetical protein
VFASAVARSASGFVAVGTHYIQPLDASGPLPPHEGRIWLSADGRSWTEVTPPDTFADVVLEHVFTTADGALIAIGRISNPDYTADEFVEPLAAWESADGSSWQRVEIGLPADLMVQELARGAGGYMAALRNYGGGGPQLWLSTNGRRWEQTYTAAADENLTDIKAGDEGFVAVGQRRPGDGADVSTFIIASADGREWIESSSPPPDALFVAPIGPDWIAIGPGPYSAYGSDIETPVWSSANGLEWSAIGSYELRHIQLDVDLECREFAANLIGAGPWLVVGTAFSYPCSEGGVVGYGSQRISVDGATWEPLPFPGFSYTNPPRVREDGSIVLAAAGTERGLVLVGQSNGRATFWYGEPR